MSRWQNALLWMLLVAAAVACVFGYRFTAEAGAGAGTTATTGVAQKIDQALDRDQSISRTADAVAGLADTTQEQALAGQAQHLAGELVDLSFAIALEQAATAAPTAAPTTAAAETPAGAEEPDPARRIGLARAAIAADQAAAARAAAGSPEAEVAAAQLALDQARLADATADAARASGNQGRLQQLLAEHTAAQTSARQATAAQLSRLAAQSQARDPATAHGLVGQLRAALLLTAKQRQLLAAEAEVRDAQRQVAATHDRLLASLRQAEAAQAAGHSGAQATVAALHALTARQQQISRFDQQDDLDSELADTYQSWLPLAVQQRREALHQAAQSALWLLAIFAVMLLLVEIIERVFERRRLDSRQAATFRHLLRLLAECGALVLALIVAFGQPTQLLTVLGLCGAGLTVAFQDAILSAAGWFVLIGRNGVHVGDWVEINGVTGEVVEVTLLKTVVVETGNWMSVGHPTGRRVFFPNNYALKGAYFNFTTSGQWMWDEVRLQLPAAADPARAGSDVAGLVARELAATTSSAEAEWTDQPRPLAAAPQPVVLLRPAAGGAELVVRYPVRAPDRTATRERLYDHLLAALAPEARPAAGAR